MQSASFAISGSSLIPNGSGADAVKRLAAPVEHIHQTLAGTIES